MRWRSRGRWIAALALLAAVPACKDDRRLRRSRDAGAAVETIGGGGEVLDAAEREPNDKREQASSLPLPGAVQGTLASRDDVDVYVFTVATATAIDVELGAVAGVDVALELIPARGEVMKSDRGGVNVSEGIAGAWLDPGEVAVVVRPFVKKAAAKAPPGDAGTWGAPAYRLTVRPSSSGDSIEREPNFDQGTANPLLLSQQVSGAIGWSGDADVWKLSLEGLGVQNALDLEISAVPGVVLTLEIWNGLGQSALVRKGEKGAALSLRGIGVVQPESAPRFHYLKITGDRSNPIDRYRLSATPRLLDLDQEVEPNETGAQATPLVAGGESADDGAMRGEAHAGDVDWFALPARDRSFVIDLSAEPGPGLDLDLLVAIASRAPVSPDAAQPAGQTERMSVVVPSGAAVAIGVRTKQLPSGAPSADYQLRWAASQVDDSLPMPPEEGGATP